MCYKLIRTPEQLQELVELLDKAKPLFCDCETMEELGKTKPKGGLYGSIRMYQFYQEGWTKAYLVDLYYVNLELLWSLVEDFHQVYHNASYDLHTLNCHFAAFVFPLKVSDTFYLAKAQYTDKQRFGFYECLAHAGLADEAIRNIDKKVQQKSDWSKFLTKEQLTYAAYDVLYLSLLYNKVKDAADLPYELDIENLKYAVRYDRKGLPINQDCVAEIRQEQMIKLEEAMEFVPVNPNSHVQCKKWLGLSATDADTLANEALRGNTGAQQLLKARKSGKILSFLEQYDRPRVRAFHNSCGARTSRMTCSGGDRYGYVNLQQPPRRLYEAMQAPPGKKLVYADFSGLELRMVGAYVGEPELERLFKDGVDVHTRTGSFLYDCTEAELGETQRWSAKMVSFTTIYGGGALTVQGIMQKQGGKLVDIKEVRLIQKKWLQLYENIKEWHRMHGRMLQVYGYIDTHSLLGRTIRAYTYTESFNFPIQASGAEVLKMSLRKLHSYGEDPKVVNVVHDSITLEHSEGKEAELWGERLTESMLWGWNEVIQHSAVPTMPMKVDTVVSTVMGVKDDAESAYDYGISDI